MGSVASDQRSWPARHEILTVLTLLGGLFVLFVIAGAMGGSRASQGSAAAATSVSQATQAPGPTDARTAVPAGKASGRVMQADTSSKVSGQNAKAVTGQLHNLSKRSPAGRPAAATHPATAHQPAPARTTPASDPVTRAPSPAGTAAHRARSVHMAAPPPPAPLHMARTTATVAKKMVPAPTKRRGR
jgi:hypothetical protein